ncbi:2,5-dioxovalerate dehydrogenase [Endozoicomonas sp. (ex Bugula neritina AB1)]|nr:2,5-dioxovalerate dehydrogenase [Endozoicomonas sp. (ex Bugula neritina AB1)]
MNLTGQMIIGSCRVEGSGERFFGINPATNGSLAPAYKSAQSKDVDDACRLAEEAFYHYSQIKPEVRASFLEKIAENIVDLGDSLIERAMEETGLPKARLEGERGRTVGQLQAFAQIVRSGLWLEPVLDSAQLDRQPLPKPDLRTRYVPLGPVAVFGASNFPLAFSVAGGDTASALAAGAPVVVKAHPAHPGTSELVGTAIQKAAVECELHPGVFSLLYCSGITVGKQLVEHPLIKAVGFTGSQAGGTALMNIAANRPVPIPVYAEMSSINPVFLLPEALNASGVNIAEGFSGALTLGAGQFCTNPGLVVAIAGDELDRFIESSVRFLVDSAPQTMLTANIFAAYQSGIKKLQKNDKVTFNLTPETDSLVNQCTPALVSVNAEDFLSSGELSEEVFGPVSVVVHCQDIGQLQAVAKNLEGQLTVTIHCHPNDYDLSSSLLPVLERKAGRVLFNGFPTGVEVSHTMIHGGPFPASSDSRSTSVGSSAIKRFVRPVCYQNIPSALAPDIIKDRNDFKLNRVVDGSMIVFEK